MFGTQEASDLPDGLTSADLEEDLVQLARQATAAQLERIARAYGRAMNAEDANRIFERRYVNYEWESDGSLSIRGNLPAEDGAVLLCALEAGRETIRETNGSCGTTTSSTGRREGGRRPRILSSSAGAITGSCTREASPWRGIRTMSSFSGIPTDSWSSHLRRWRLVAGARGMAAVDG